MYIVTGTSLLGCSAMDTVNVIVDTIPIVLASADTNVCLGDTVRLSASGATTYVWDNGLGAGQNQNALTAIDTMFIVTGSNSLCSAKDTVNVIVNALPAVTASNDTTICLGDTALISATSVINSYVWDNGLGAGQQHNVSPTTLTNYIVSVADLNNCIGVDTVTVDINQLPILSTTSDTSLCENDTLNLFVTGADSYLWDNGLGIGAGHTVQSPIDTVYRVIGTDVNGCVSTDSVVVSLNLVNVVASNDTLICLGAMTTISASGASTYTWNNSLGS